MKSLKYLVLGAFPLFSLVHAQDFATFDLVADFASAEVELDGLAGPYAGASQATIDLFNANYGSIATGNTISRADFMTKMASAHAAGRGGVAGFEDAGASYSDTSDRAVDYFSLGGLATVNRGANFYAEGGNADAYRGKENAGFDGTGPSPSVDSSRRFEIGDSGSRFEVGERGLGGATSFELDFDPLDQVYVIGFMYLNYHNFQSYQRGNADYPNTHARAVWTNGLDSITQMAVQYSDQDNPSDVFFGFQQPGEGYFLDSLSYYTIGNSARAWTGIDELGIAVVPEPGMVALLLGLGALGFVAMRRRR
jgi:hypothetical protein